MLLIVLVVVACVVLFLSALILPLASRKPQRGAGKALGSAARQGRKAPGPLGRAVSKPFSTARKATDASAAGGRRARGRLPF